MALGRVAPFTRTRTYWFGRSTPCGLSTDARTRNVPVCALNAGSVNVMLPVNGNTWPSTSTTSTTYLLLGARRSRPLSAWSRRLCSSFSDRLKFTHIGDSTATVVSWALVWLRYVPSAWAAAPLMPATGEVMVQ